MSNQVKMNIFKGLWFCKYWKLAWIIFIMLLPPVIPEETIYRVDPLALLSGTLRTYQKAVCDNESMSLSCPRGTSISIDIAQYGNTLKDGPVRNMCPTKTDENQLDKMHVGTEIEVKPLENCLSHALQYSLLQFVVEACQKKSHCKFTPSSRTLNNDPCPESPKFLEIAYKCRPYEFRSKVACENESIQIVCNPYSRIAIYSASFGRTEYESIQCAQPQGVMEESCLASYGTETVMHICHGRRRCAISADRATFGDPCRHDSRIYLKVVYTCIPRKVLKDQYDYSTEPDETHQIDLEHNDDLYDEDQFYRESEANPPAPKLQRELATSEVPSSIESPTSDSPPVKARDGDQLEVPKHTRIYYSTMYNQTHIRKLDGNNNKPVKENTEPRTYYDKFSDFVLQWINTYNYLAQNQEKFFIYLFMSVTIGVLLCLLMVIGRLAIQKRQLKQSDKKEQSLNTTSEITIPNGFSDDMSEIDGDIDMTTSLSVPNASRNEQNYGAYAPSPSPYGNLGPSNISHTSSTMLVPSNTIISGHPPSIISTPNTLMYHPSVNVSTSLGPSMLSSNYPAPNVGFMNASSMIAAHNSTLRRQREYESTPPRILSKIDVDPQYYYG